MKYLNSIIPNWPLFFIGGEITIIYIKLSINCLFSETFINTICKLYINLPIREHFYGTQHYSKNNQRVPGMR